MAACGAQASVALRNGFHMSITAKRIRALFGFPSSPKNSLRLSSERSLPPNLDRSAPFQVAHHNPVSVTFANRYLVNADNLRLGFTGMRELRLDILLVQLFDRVPVKFKFLGYVFDGRRAATTPDMVGKPLGVKRVVRQKRQLLSLHFPAVSTKDPANFELQVHPRVSTRQVSYPTRSSVVPTPLYSRAAPAGRFFDRRTSRAFGSPKTPRTVGCTRNPLNAYVSHNRRTRFFDVAIATPCQNSPYPKMLHSHSPSGFQTNLMPKFTHSITRRPFSLSYYQFKV